MTLDVLLRTHAMEVLAGLTGFFILLSLVQLAMYRRLARQFRRYRALVEKAGPQGLGDALAACARVVETVDERVAEIRRRQRELERELRTCVRTPGVVRFNAFDDVGSDLSYACALLDAKGDGVVLSGLFGRYEARTYAKPVKDGESAYHLTDEEKDAITAVQGGRKDK
ncbi:MAG: DUF4446 family protein [Thermoanaerobacterales bacterium]|nr:DUF4446 family protein [Bacillota bacterium]MDI6907741.1 DUF4446 family protein [Thermoanaerobacterales bacterium]